ncbi:hypothetical protein K0504_06165 [Neiella marina]|uniref:PepSY domain-containing protein n=1 Tax=Neiella holothuriorum TaxID=2870530 RepID=A0ABS7EE65_9GAMM|nr:hypothetical protein [Neiella holothuriorum]MBW8190617.1 hypothetical protein [Neiella holothuriorum]
MNTKFRMLWMKLHAYVACFFLPITVLFVATGILYLFDIEGGVADEFHYQLPAETVWPDNEQTAIDMVEPYLIAEDHMRRPAAYWWWEGTHVWFDYKQEVTLRPDNGEGFIELEVKEHDWWHRLLLIHKGFGSQLLWLFGLLFGVSLVFSIGTGVILALQIRQVKVMSMMSIGAGFVSLVGLIIFG